MALFQLKPNFGATKYRKRVGRGSGSGMGKTSGKGHKGQKARAGKNQPYTGFEGGQIPSYRRLPKRGFKNVLAEKIAEVNINGLTQKFENGETVDLLSLKDKKLISKSFKKVKLLGNGKLEKKLDIKVHFASKSAQEKVKAAGSTLTLLTSN